MPYDKLFFENQSPGSRQSAHEIVPLIMELVHPASVVDVGCGVGTWLGEFSTRGVTDLQGIDGDYVDRDQLQFPRDSFMAADLGKPCDASRRFDLAVSLEVAEHLPPAAADIIVKTLADLAPVVLFSAAIPNQNGHNHLNEQWPAYWAERFATLGYLSIDCLRHRIWLNHTVKFWYAQNMILYVDKTHLPGAPILADLYERYGGLPLPLVHPRKFEEYVDLYARECAKSALEKELETLRKRIPRPVKTTLRRVLPLRPVLDRAASR